jgi:hypothetical protein
MRDASREEGDMTPSRRRSPAFIPFAVLTIAGLFVLDGIASGVVLVFASLAFFVACIVNLRGERVVGGKYGPLGL